MLAEQDGQSSQLPKSVQRRWERAVLYSHHLYKFEDALKPKTLPEGVWLLDGNGWAKAWYTVHAGIGSIPSCETERKVGRTAYFLTLAAFFEASI